MFTLIHPPLSNDRKPTDLIPDNIIAVITCFNVIDIDSTRKGLIVEIQKVKCLCATLVALCQTFICIEG